MNLREYLFSLAMEEAGEVAQAANKCNRFTPDHAYYEQSNIERLQTEVTDLITVLHLITRETGFAFSLAVSDVKIERINKYMAISREMGTLQDGP